jgi:phospholipase/carboxylesterase
MENCTWNGQVDVSRPVRFVSDRPPGTAAQCLVIALHGYGMNSAQMLDWTRKLIGDDPVIVSVEAPNAGHLGPDPRTAQTGYNWGIRDTTDFHVAFHQSIILAVLENSWRSYPGARERTILAGFSQPVGLNYRFASAHPGTLRGVLALCGGVPEDWDASAVRPLPLSVFHVARTEDEYYPSDTIATFDRRLRRSVEDVTMLKMAGQHRYPFAAGDEICDWIERLSG